MRIVFGRQGVLASPGGRWIAETRPGWDLAEGHGDEWRRLAAGADVLVPIVSPVDAALVATTSARLVQQMGVGLDTIDLAACAAAGIAVANVPSTVSGNAESVAEIAVMLSISLARDVEMSRASLREGSHAMRVPRMLAGRHVVLVGLGGLGVATAARLAPFGVRITAVRADPAKGGAPGVGRVVGPDALDDVLPDADGIVLCAAPSDRPMFTAQRLALVKRGAFLVNVARGALIDEPALIAALDDGTLSGAGLDVIANEPPQPGDPLLTHPKVVVLPHIGGVTAENLIGTARAIVENVERFEAGEPLNWRA